MSISAGMTFVRPSSPGSAATRRPQFFPGPPSIAYRRDATSWGLVHVDGMESKTAHPPPGSPGAEGSADTVVAELFLVHRLALVRLAFLWWATRCQSPQSVETVLCHSGPQQGR